LREVSRRKCLADTVLAGVGDVPQGVEQTKGLKHPCVNANTNRGVALLDALEGRTRCKGTLRHHSHGQAPAPPGIPNIRTQLAQHTADPGRREMWCRHGGFFMRLYLRFV
jgi:hypothetical protein